jgi:phosphohistidine phosphatase
MSDQSPARRLVVLRHAKSDWPRGVPDAERPLAARGMAACEAMGRFLRDRRIVPDEVIASPARRTMDTARLVLDAAGYGTAVTPERALYEGDAVRVLTRVDPAVSTVMLVGHEPEMVDLLAALTGARVRLPTAGLALVALPGSWAAEPSGIAELRLLTTPKLLGCVE